MVGTLISGGFGALSEYQQGQGQQQVYNANSRIERTNAINAQTSAAANAQTIEQNTSRVVGQAGATAGASGVEATGSPMAVMHDIATQGNLERRLAIYKGQLSASGYMGQSAIDLAEGNQAAQAGEAAAIGTLLTTGMSGAQQAFPGTMAELNQPWAGG